MAIVSRSAGVTAAIMGIVALTFAGCGGQPAQTDGIVTGRASPCIGPAPPPGVNIQNFRYTISLEQGSRIIARENLKGDADATYRFDVPAGHYRLKNGPGAVVVIVRHGQTIHANLYEPCG
jgi:hypothetical protein